MRYYKQPDVLFQGVLIKEELPLVPRAKTTKKHEQYSGQPLDELACYYYGDGMESECYKIFNENIVELTEANFDVSKLRSVRIPPL
ncbi:MAG: hypothetical protein LBP19_05340 [Treponema sp.]|jgi:hypothetical protein|nr:hypothetical protein [Treponema sp.]